MKKISLFKSLAILGAVTLTSVCVTETVLLIHKNNTPQNDALIDISTYQNYSIDVPPEEIYGAFDAVQLLDVVSGAGIVPLSGGTKVILTNISDLQISTITPTSFILASINNSAVYMPNKFVTIYIITGTPISLNSIITSVPDLFLDKYEDDEITKATILKNLQTQYPSLNINQLEVNTLTDLGGTMYSANVVAKNHSVLYSGEIAVTYYVSGAAVLTYANPTLVSGDVNKLPTFTWKNASISGGTLIYTCANVSDPISFSTSNGAFGYNANVNFNGALYQVKASYTPTGSSITYIAYANVFAQPYSGYNANRLTLTSEASAGYCKLFVIQAASLKEVNGTFDISRAGSTPTPDRTLRGSFSFIKEGTEKLTSDIFTQYGVARKNLFYKIISSSQIEIWIYSLDNYVTGEINITSTYVGAGGGTVTITKQPMSWTTVQPTDSIAFNDPNATKTGTFTVNSDNASSVRELVVYQNGKNCFVAMRINVVALQQAGGVTIGTISNMSLPITNVNFFAFVWGSSTSAFGITNSVGNIQLYCQASTSALDYRFSFSYIV